MTESTEQPETTELDTSKLVSPDKPEYKDEDFGTVDPDKMAKESTPVFDEVEADPEVPEIASSYKADVKRALARQTDDGKGDDDPGDSDFESFATEGVEKEEDVE